MRRIQTYVFVDLETTGMPSEENNTTKIAELSMIAVKRQHLLDTAMGKFPRVQNKLTLCFNPWKIMAPEGSKITGLDNFLLEYEMKFDKDSFELIDKFLGCLMQPVCLIAHNGYNFDYPILKNNMQKINVDFSCDVKCADCYFAFYRILDNSKNNVGIQNVNAFPETSKKIKVNENEMSSKRNPRVKRQLERDFNSIINNHECLDNGDRTKLKIIRKETTDHSTDKPLKTDTKIKSPSNNISIANLKNVTDDTIVDLALDDSQEVQKANEITPNGNGLHVNSKIPSPAKNGVAVDNCDGFIPSQVSTALLNLKEFVDDEIVELLANDRKQIQKINESTPKQKIIPSSRSYPKTKSKKRFPWSQDSKPEESYKLSDIYKRQLNRETPEAHRAENDCIMALEIAVTVANEFVKWIDEHNLDFKDIEPMTIGVKL